MTHFQNQPGLVVVPHIDARDNLSGCLQGTLVFVQSNGMTYRLEGTSWAPRLYDVSDPSVRTLFVNITTGDDENDGLSALKPLKSPSTAVRKLEAAHKGLPVWEEGDNRRVVVDGADGAEWVGSLVVGPRAGGGALILDCLMEVEHTLTLGATPFNNIPTKEVRREAAFVTAPLTPGAFDKAAFLVAEDRSTSFDPFTDVWEDLPIVANAAGTADVTALDPGAETAFAFTPGAWVSVCRPKITFRPPPETEGVQGTCPAWLEAFAPVIVRGAEFKSHATNFLDQGFGCLVRSHVKAGRGTYGTAPVTFNRSIVDGRVAADRFRTLSVGDVAFAGCILRETSFGEDVGNAGAVGLVNVFVETSFAGGGGNQFTVYGVDRASLKGLDVEGGIFCSDCGRVYMWADGQDEPVSFGGVNQGIVYALSTYGALNAITVGRGFVSTLVAEDNGRIQGAGTVKGLQIGSYGSFTGRETNPISAPGNEIQIVKGPEPDLDRTWAQGAYSDPDVFVRLRILP